MFKTDDQLDFKSFITIVSHMTNENEINIIYIYKFLVENNKSGNNEELIILKSWCIFISSNDIWRIIIRIQNTIENIENNSMKII